MPTGYTAAVSSGEITEFADFAMQCARAFGALILMRDDPSDAEIPDEFPVDDYAMKALIRARERLTELRAMTSDDAYRAAGVDYDKALAAYREGQRKQAEEQRRYEAMLDQVLRWEPPTDEHVELKSFMVQQLEESIRFDCGYDWPAPTRQSGKEWLADQVAKAEQDVTYYADEHEKAVDRAEGRSKWVRDLRESLKAATS